MKTTINDIRELVDCIIFEQKISASPEYMQKEKIREELQKIISDRVASDLVKNDKDLSSLIADMNTAMIALKMVPLDAWKRLAKK